MPPHTTVPIIAAHAMCDDLLAPLAISYAYDRIVVLGRIFVVRFLQVRTEFHERARRKRVVIRTRLREERLVQQRSQYLVRFLDRYACVSGL